MDEEIKGAAPAPTPESAPESGATEEKQPEAQSEISDPQALLSAFERQKAANAELKAKMAQYDELLSTVAESVGAEAPSTSGKSKADRSAIEALNKFQLDQRLEQIKQDAAAAKEQELSARHRQQLEQERQRYAEALRQAETYQQQLDQFQKRTKISALFAEAGGEAEDFDNFYALMANRIEWEGDTPVGVIDGGEPAYDESNAKKLSPSDYFALIRQGRKGTPMLQSAFKAWNQSQGTGISKQPLAATRAGRRTFPRAQMNEVLQDMAARNLTEAQMNEELRNINWV